MSTPRKERVYIAGPMTGIDLYNFPLFDQVKERVAAAGFEPISPADLTRKNFGDPNHPDPKVRFIAEPEHYPLFMKVDIGHLTLCQRILFLKGWKYSDGATTEAYNARRFGLIPGTIDDVGTIVWYDPKSTWWDDNGVPKSLKQQPKGVPQIASDDDIEDIKQKIAASLGVDPEDVVVAHEPEDPMAIQRAAQTASQLGMPAVPTHLVTGKHTPNRQASRPAPRVEGAQVTTSPTARPAVNSETMLGIADNLVSHTRQGEYGHPADNFDAMAKIFSGITKLDIRREHIPLMLIGLKMARESNKHHPDNYTDIAGYAKTALMAKEKWRGDE